MPKETCIVTLLLGGIRGCPRVPRNAPGGAGGTIPREDYGEEAYNFTRSRVLQRAVQIKVRGRCLKMLGSLYTGRSEGGNEVDR